MMARPGSIRGGVSARVVRDVFLLLGCTLAVGLLLKMFLVTAFFVPTSSMERTLLPGDFVLVNRLAYGVRIPRCLPVMSIALSRTSGFSFSSPRRGDIIAFEKPSPEGSDCVVPTLLKRCAGIPGDTLSYRGNRLRVAGFSAEIPGGDPTATPRSIVLPRAGETIELCATSAEVFRPLIEEEGHTVTIGQDGLVKVDGLPAAEYTVEQDAFFVLGDNPSSSLDSRLFGVVPARRIVGKAFLIYWSRTEARESYGFGDFLQGVRWTRIGTLLH